MIELFKAAAVLQQVLDDRGWQFCFIGGIANVRWGEPRQTSDLDVTLLTGFGDEERYIRDLLGSFDSRISDASSFALQNRVLLLYAPSGHGIDIGLGALPFETELVQRSSLFPFFEGITLRTCSAEDLVILKAFASRNRDWGDIEGVLLKSKGLLDWPLIWRHLAELVELKGEPEILLELERQIHEVQRVIGPFQYR